jgi:hypothetical protein
MYFVLNDFWSTVVVLVSVHSMQFFLKIISYSFWNFQDDILLLPKNWKEVQIVGKIIIVSVWWCLIGMEEFKTKQHLWEACTIFSLQKIVLFFERIKKIVCACNCKQDKQTTVLRMLLAVVLYQNFFKVCPLIIQKTSDKN